MFFQFYLVQVKIRIKILKKKFLLLKGVIWPVEGMPKVMRFISNFTPLTHSVAAIRCIASRGKLNKNLISI